MKKIILTFVLMLAISITFFAQNNSGFKYQAVARDSASQPYMNTTISLEISLLSQSTTGTTVYSELHETTTTEIGLFDLTIGKGTPTLGSFNNIQWGTTDYFLSVKMKLANETTFTLMGVSPLMSVPYALHAKTVENVNDADANPSNEIQNLSINGTTLSLSNGGGSVELPVIGSSGDPINYSAGNGISISNNVISNTGDTNPSNEIQHLSLNGNALSLSNGGGSVQLPNSDPVNYSAGNGISISNNVVSNTGDTNPNDDLTTNSQAGGDINGHFSNLQIKSGAIGSNEISDGSIQHNDLAPGLIPHYLRDLSDVSINSPGNGDFLKWNGSKWTAGSPVSNPVWSKNGQDIYYKYGNVGIGTSNPEYGLTISDNKPYIQFIETDNQNKKWHVGMYNQSLVFSDNGGYAKMTIKQNGNVGIGTTNPTTALTIFRHGSPQLELSDNKGLYKLWGGLNFHIRDKNNKDRFYISSTGNVGIGTISPARKLSVPSGGISTDAFYTYNNSGKTRVVTYTSSKDVGVIYGYGSNGKVNFFLGNKESSRPNDGQLILYGTTGKSNGTSGGISKYPVRMYSYNNKGYIRADNISQWSDRRIKKDIITLENGLEKILQLRGVRYNMKEDSIVSGTNPKEIGLIAQEVEEVTPELVNQEDDGLRSVNYAKMTAVLIEAIKDQQNIINQQLETIRQLQANTQDIEARLSVLEKNELEEKTAASITKE